MQRDAETEARLQAELGNMRAYLASHPGATPTRVTKAALKEITPGGNEGNGNGARQAWQSPRPDVPLDAEGKASR